VTEEEAADAATMLSTAGIATTPSGAAGFAGAIGYENAVGGLGPDARVLVVVTEGT
jgi:diaminopropionate ammonia-lyase